MLIATAARQPVSRDIVIRPLERIDDAVSASIERGLRVGADLSDEFAGGDSRGVRAGIRSHISPHPSGTAQAAELAFMHELQATRTGAEVARAKTLAVAGEHRLWTETFDAYNASAPLADAAAGRDLVEQAQRLANTLSSHAKREHDRPRPFNADPTLTPVVRRPPGATSYPSSHTANAFGAAMALATLWPEHAGELRALAMEVARSRVLGGVHFPSDVALGAFLGTAAAAAVTAGAAAE